MKKAIIAGFIVLIFAVSVVLYRSADPLRSVFSLTDTNGKSIVADGELLIGSDVPYGVMEEFDETGGIVGIDPDIAGVIGKRLGVRVVFRSYSFDELLEAVKAGSVDLAMSAITITPERRRDMLFSEPYFAGGQVLVTRKGNSDVRSASDLTGRKIAAQAGTTSLEKAREFVPDSSITQFGSLETEPGLPKPAVVNDLEQNRFDALVIDYIAAIDLVSDYPGIEMVGDPISQEYYGIATAKTNTELMEAVNLVLRDMKRSGELDAIIRNWLNP